MHNVKCGILKWMIFLYNLYCGGQGCPPQYKNIYGKTMILKIPSYDLRVQSFVNFEGLL